MSVEKTMRAHLEAIIGETEGWKIEHEPILQHAVAALNLIAQSQRYLAYDGTEYALIPDPPVGSSVRDTTPKETT